MDRVIKPLAEMGADIRSLSGNGLAPLSVNGKKLHGIRYHSPVASAQVKSCILLAGLYADSETTVIEPFLSRDHTERMCKLASHINSTARDSLNGRTPFDLAELLLDKRIPALSGLYKVSETTSF